MRFGLVIEQKFVVDVVVVIGVAVGTRSVGLRPSKAHEDSLLDNGAELELEVAKLRKEVQPRVVIVSEFADIGPIQPGPDRMRNGVLANL